MILLQLPLTSHNASSIQQSSFDARRMNGPGQSDKVEYSCFFYLNHENEVRMAEWHVNLQGDDFDLAALAARFTSQDFRIQREGTVYCLMADELNTLEDPREVRDAAERILQPLNGLAKLMLNARRPLSVSSLYQIKGDRKNHHYLLADAGSLSLQESAAVLKIGSDGTSEAVQQQDPMHSQLSLSWVDENVKRVLSLYGKADQTWKDLYPIYEIIESDLGGEAALVDKGWTSRNQIERFARTANSPEASGETARHGIPKGAPPSNPMTPSEGKEFIASLILKWIESKLTKQR